MAQKNDPVDKNKLEDLRKAQFYLNRLITDKIEANKKQ